jgi:hypothetical protein
MMIIVLTIVPVTEMQSYKDSWGYGATRVGGVVKYFLRSLKASCASLVHWNFSRFLRGLKKGSPLTPSREINLLLAAIHPINLCTSWRLSGDVIFVIVDTFFGLGSIPRRWTIYLSSFSEGMP